MSAPFPTGDTAAVDVVFSLFSPGAHTVSLAILFNQWSPELPPSEQVIPSAPYRFRNRSHCYDPRHEDCLMVRALVRLQQVTTGRWRSAVSLPPGWYEYLFLVNGEWTMDPTAPEVRPDSAGGFIAARWVEPAGQPAGNARPLAGVATDGLRPLLRLRV